MIYVDTDNGASKKSTILLTIILGIGLFFVVRTIIDATKPVTPPAGTQNPVIQTPVANDNTGGTITPNQPSNPSTPVEGNTLCEIATGDSGKLMSGAAIDRRWYLIGTEFTEAQKTLNLNLKFNNDVQSILQTNEKPVITYEILGTPKSGNVTVKKDAEQDYSQGIYIGDLEPSEYTIKATSSFISGPVQTVQCKFNVSYPVYVLWTFDWEGYDVNQEFLNNMDSISNRYGIYMTHFFNPRIYVPGVMSADRANYLTNWVTNRAKNNGDSLGLHMHMFLDMVKTAGVAPKTTPNWGGNYPDGYNVLTSAYSYEEMTTILSWAKKMFTDHGLPVPKMYRAGGWHASLTTLMSIQDNGFIADSSGRTKYSVIPGGLEGPWNLSPTSQPYHPNDFNQNISDSPNMKLWEFPNNGGESYLFTAEQMIDRFKQNYNGGQAKSRTTVNFLSHPHWFNIDKPKIEKLFSVVDQFSSNKDQGPVVYINMDNLYKVYAGIK